GLARSTIQKRTRQNVIHRGDKAGMCISALHTRTSDSNSIPLLPGQVCRADMDNHLIQKGRNASCRPRLYNSHWIATSQLPITKSTLISKIPLTTSFG